MFLICNAAITDPPHLSEGWPEISDKSSGPHRQDPSHQRRQPQRRHTEDGGGPGKADEAAVQDVVGAVDFMHRARNLEQTPGLIDADVADDVRSVHASRKLLDTRRLRREAGSGWRQRCG